jgi:hypothetical protein
LDISAMTNPSTEQVRALIDRLNERKLAFARQPEAAATLEALLAERERMRQALENIRGMTKRKQLPLTAQINEVATRMIGIGHD